MCVRFSRFCYYIGEKHTFHFLLHYMHFPFQCIALYCAVPMQFIHRLISIPIIFCHATEKRIALLIIIKVTLIYLFRKDRFLNISFFNLSKFCLTKLGRIWFFPIMFQPGKLFECLSIFPSTLKNKFTHPFNYKYCFTKHVTFSFLVLFLNYCFSTVCT